MSRIRTAAFVLLLGARAVVAHAAPPPDADPALAPWFQSLRQPGTGASCCGLGDCRMTESRIVNGHYEALVGNHWTVVPPDKILQRTDNPTGRAVICWVPLRGVVCFVRAPET
ncbi:MAG TPA: hypothetical protein VKY65_14815 [Alphaproteobacteria bacterium]|nr:hypothetical protein [Alphaproteobacteria bacterium]